MVAGEASGDRYGAHLIDALRGRVDAVEGWGIGGDRMIAAGFEPLREIRDVAVVGLVEVISKLPLFIGAMRDLRRRAARDRPDLAILIDYPDFNLRLARHLKNLGVPVLYFVSPQVWAWRPGRIRMISRRVDAMAVILPFEVPLYRNEGVEVEYVGHPLVDLATAGSSRDEARRRFGVSGDTKVVGLLPGSRMGECARILPVLLDAAAILHREIPGIRFLIPLAEGLERRPIEHMIRSRRLPVTVVERNFYDVLQACDTIAVASGTATLEAALLGVPMVIVYRLNPLTYWIGSRLATVDMIGLANLVLGRRVVPELVQGDCRPDRVAAELRRLLRNPTLRGQIRQQLLEVRRRLGRGGAFTNTADMAVRLLQGISVKSAPRTAAEVEQ
jgi:lipid-A-disaccharide synthase